MTAGIVDHETGTRDIRALGGLRRAMPPDLCHRDAGCAVDGGAFPC